MPLHSPFYFFYFLVSRNNSYAVSQPLTMRRSFAPMPGHGENKNASRPDEEIGKKINF
jgi:hypothetical protein